MKDALEILAELFAHVPDGTEQLGRGGGRIGGVIDPQITGPLAVPLAWLTAYGVPIKQVQDCDLPNGVQALFRCSPPQVWIPLRAHTGSSDTLWSVWHEAAHACDLVQPQGAGRWPVPRLSSRHGALLGRHKETIIEWNPGARGYKTQPIELWAEAMAAALCDPGRMPPELLAGIRPDLLQLKLPVL